VPLATDRVYLATYVTISTGGLLHHPFTFDHPLLEIGEKKRGDSLVGYNEWSSSLCCTCP